MKNIFSKVRNVTIVLLGLGIGSACSDYLDVPVNGLLSEDDFYLTDEDAVVGLTAAYDRLSNTYNHIWASMYLIREIPSDDSNAGGADDKDQQGHQLIDDFKHDSQNDQILPAWRNLWGLVYRANKVINKTVGDSDLKKRVIAEAKFIRALAYMDLVTFWGDVPLVTDDIPASDFASIPRVDKAQVYAQMETDLTDAAADLPLKSAYAAGDKFRATKGAAQSLLGKVYLYQKKYTDAANIFETVIGSGQYSLENKTIFNFSKGTEFGRESVFEVNYVNTQQYDWGNYPWGCPCEDNIIIQLMGPRSVDGTPYVAPAGDSITLGWGFVNPTQELYDAYVDAGDVTRRKTTLMSKAEFDAAGGTWTPDDWDFENMMRRKYGHYPTESGGPIGELNHTTNWRLIRYADVLLMAAEANALKSSPDETKAKQYLNMVRQRPGNNGELAAVTASGAALMDAIILERRLELAFEGHRFADLVRWGLADDELSDLGFVAGKHELLPIPNQDVVAAGMDQNDGY
jgi:starch-binding outer membrane protein, SusD/RagB family